MRMTTALVALVAFLFDSGAIVAEPTRITGEFLNETCATAETSPICSAYFIGFLYGSRMDNAARQDGKPICLHDVTASELRTQFMLFAHRHKEMLDQDAGFLVGAIAAANYPCHDSK